MISLKKHDHNIDGGWIIAPQTNNEIVKEVLSTNTFIGIDFGTSTTVASYMLIDKRGGVNLDTFKLEQPTQYGGTCTHELVNSVLAWQENKLLFGHDAYAIKQNLFEGANLFSSFKMLLGVDVGPTYPETRLSNKYNTPYVIEYASDAARIFFELLLTAIKKEVEHNHFSDNLIYSISVPASFEANQRQDLVKIINDAGYPVSESCLIDEPNAAFLSYAYQCTKEETKPKFLELLIAKKLVNVLVYDFGAGTCDISILEIKTLEGSFTSRNRAISRFTALGGDDFDREIARKHLLEQLLKSQPDYQPTLNHINEKLIPRLMPAAERLKIEIIKYISDRNISTTEATLKLENKYFTTLSVKPFKMLNNLLSLPQPTLSLHELAVIMDEYTSTYDQVLHYNKKHVFAPVDEAMSKIGMKYNELDAVLFIGGSSENPLVRQAVMRPLPESVLEIVPKNLQTHVSLGACLHSFFYNGMHKDLIKPITPEDIYVIVIGGIKKLIPASTEVPTENDFIISLSVAKENQTVIELPFCAGNKNKILGNLIINSKTKGGFKINSDVIVNASITHDKLLKIEVEIYHNNELLEKTTTALLNPLANKELTDNEKSLLQAKQKFNLALLKYGATNMPASAVIDYAIAAERAGAFEIAADMFSTVERIDPKLDYSTNIAYNYSRVGKIEKAELWFRTAYRRKQNALTCYNLSLYETDQRKISLLRESLEHDPTYTSSLYQLGTALYNQNSPEGMAILKKYAELIKKEIKSPYIAIYALHNTIQCAMILNDTDLKEKAEARIKDFNEIIDKTGPYKTSNILSDIDQTTQTKV
jgi:molecular chaperone DnaK (HSP70)